MVTPAEVASGRACECTCPGCARPLQARKGEQNVWHFAHDGGGCATGAETAIHRMAKQILAAEKTIQLPAVQVTLSAIDAFGRERTVTASLAKPQLVHYMEVDLEVRSANRRADALGTLEHGAKHWIEVFVRHAVNSDKAQELEAREYVSFEICLNDVQTYVSLEQLRAAVTSSPERVRWISYPGMTALRKALTEKLDRMLQALKLQKEADDAKAAQAWQAQMRAASAGRMGRTRLQDEKLRKDGQLTLANKTFRQADEVTKREYLKAKLRLPDGHVPALIDVEVRGQHAFGVPRDVWQGDLFRKWIFAEGRRDVSLETILEWLATRYEVSTAATDSPKVAVWQYFKFLEAAGYVRHRGRQYFEVTRDVAPWLESSLEVVGTWFWSRTANACSLQSLHEANEAAGAALSTTVLLELFRRIRAERNNDGEPDDAARTVAQRFKVSPNTVLAVLSAANVVSNPRSIGYNLPAP